MILNRNSKEELQWWIKKLKNLPCSLLDSVSQSSSNTDDASKKGWGAMCQGISTGGAMVKGGTAVTHKCIRTQSSKISTFDLQQIKIFESNSLSCRQHHCTTLPCEYRGTKCY